MPVRGIEAAHTPAGGRARLAGRLVAGMQHQNAPRRVDARIADLAARQHGVVAWRQLLALGLSPGGIARRVTAGRLHVLHRGVYAVGHRAVSGHGRWLAAVLACGEGAVLSHQTAAALWGVRPSASPRVHVTVPTRSGRRGPAGITVHRPRTVPPAETTLEDGIPVTTPARTLLDLAATGDARTVDRAVEAAERLRLFDLVAVQDVLAAHPRRAGGRALRRAVAAADPAPVRSELERRFLELCVHHGLPRPVVNARVGGHEVDLHWPAQRLAVELDGYAVHGTRAAFERDRARDVRLALAGLRVVRFSFARVTAEPATVAAEVRGLLAMSA